MNTAKKIINNLINENMKKYGQFIKTRCVMFGNNQFISKHISIYTKSFNILFYLDVLDCLYVKCV